MNFQEAIKRAQELNPDRISRDLFQKVRQIEKQLIDLNVGQIERRESSLGSVLKNINTAYSGFYTQYTEEISENSISIALGERPNKPKRAGEPYNFDWTGEFLSGFEMEISNDTISLGSTGQGSGSKEIFFSGFRDLFGLTDESLQKVIDEELLPFFLTYFKENL